MQWILFSLVLSIVGFIIHFTAWPVNKQTWSPSYLFMMAGVAGFSLSFFYLIIDCQAWQPQFMKRSRMFFAWQWKLTDVVS
jgi:predicted acyltransferase